MSLIRLDIADFRNLISVKIEPIPYGFNFIHGDNGSGKTSILEAIYYLSLGRSFRSSVNNRIISNLADKFSLFAHVLTSPGQSIIPIGLIRHQSQGIQIRIAGEDVHSIAELASITPVQLINSSCYNLLEAPAFRRKYLDWGAFYLSNEFLRIWRLYDRALRQRNAALRGQLSKHELAPWTQELVENTAILDKIRQEYVENLLPLLTQTVNELLPKTIGGAAQSDGFYNVEMSYQRGWNEAISYEEILADVIDRDRQLGYTQYGPHRADFKINVNKVPAKDILSRGQQKLFVCAMLLAQGTLLNRHANKKPIYLVDDLPAELDSTSRTSLMSQLSKQEAQVFVTAVERETLEGFLSHNPTKMFHVEHGKVR